MRLENLKSWILKRPSDPVALVVGAGDVGSSFGRALLVKRGYRVIMTRRTLAAVAALEDELIGLIPNGARTSDYGVFPLDPLNTIEVQKFGEVVKEALRRPNMADRGLGVLVLACGKAIFDSDGSMEANLRANFLTKSTCFSALQEAGLVQRYTTVVIASSRVLSFASDAPEVATQQSYRASIQALEDWAKMLMIEKKLVLRVPLLAGHTGHEYRSAGVVPEDLILTDSYVYACEQVQGL